MNDIFKDMKIKTGIEYILDLPSRKKVIWKELKNNFFHSRQKKLLETYPNNLFYSLCFMSLLF